MAASGTVWAIDIGNYSIKALHLSLKITGQVEVIGYDNILHGKILSGKGVSDEERDELIALSLRQFVSRNDIGKEEIVISVPSQNSFARFVNLPPVEQKRVPEIVKFEAAQQIPFDLNEVQWDWQELGRSDTGETKVGIFAIKNDVVQAELEHFERESVMVSHVQMSPMALYNYLLFDRPEFCKSDREATVILNIGAENTDLVVCTASAVWQRCMPIGGNSFTRAIADAFKLNFEKAEKLKRTATMSKYARQILQAMKPVFSDLAGEVQRSLGYYSQSNPGVKLTRVIALGGGTKMRGLLKYLQQSLQITVERPEAFKQVIIGPDVSAANFHDNVGDLGVVYGLALQGLELGKIECNLLPKSAARSMAWASKSKYFIAAASLLLLVSVLSLARTFIDSAAYAAKDNIRRENRRVIETAEQAANKLRTEQNKSQEYEVNISKFENTLKYRETLPILQQVIVNSLPNPENTPEQAELYKAFTLCDIGTIKQIPRKQRKQMFVTNVSISFSPDIIKSEFGEIDYRKLQNSTSTRGGDKAADLMMSQFMMMGMDPMMMGGGYGDERSDSKFKSKSQRKDYKVEDDEDKDEGPKPGFVISIGGYCPYGNIQELVDPVLLVDDPNKWGFITRLEHLDKFFDANSPFELYKKASAKHFKFTSNPILVGSKDLPGVIGVEDTLIFETSRITSKQKEKVLIDPMTREVISKVLERDGNGNPKVDKMGAELHSENDRWFRIDMKFAWKDAPVGAAPQGQ